MTVQYVGRPRFDEVDRERAAALREQRVKRAVAKIPAEYRDATLGGPELAVRLRGATDVSWLIARARTASIVVIAGAAGTGKTTLMAALFRDAVQADLAGAEWLDAFELAFAWKEHGLGHGKPPVVQLAISMELVAIDDLGAEPSVNDSAIGQVLYTRHAAQRRTLLTTVYPLPTGDDPGELARRYGDGISRKALERALWIELGKA